MTKNEIMAMDSGIDIDCLIEKTFFDKDGYMSDYAVINETKYAIPTWIPSGYIADNLPLGWYASKTPKNYSTDMTAAWIVVEKLLDNVGIDFMLTSTMDRKYQFVIDDDGNEVARVIADTAPEAICKAALVSCCGEATQCK